MNPVFSMISFTLTQSPTQMHKASEFLDSFFFCPQERKMIQDDAVLHKQLTSPCSHSSSPIMSFIWPKFTYWEVSFSRNIIYVAIIFALILSQIFINIKSSNMPYEYDLFDVVIIPSAAGLSRDAVYARDRLLKITDDTYNLHRNSVLNPSTWRS